MSHPARGFEALTRRRPHLRHCLCRQNRQRRPSRAEAPPEYPRVAPKTLRTRQGVTPWERLFVLREANQTCAREMARRAPNRVRRYRPGKQPSWLPRNSREGRGPPGLPERKATVNRKGLLRRQTTSPSHNDRLSRYQMTKWRPRCKFVPSMSHDARLGSEIPLTRALPAFSLKPGVTVRERLYSGSLCAEVLWSCKLNCCVRELRE